MKYTQTYLILLCACFVHYGRCMYNQNEQHLDILQKAVNGMEQEFGYDPEMNDAGSSSLQTPESNGYGPLNAVLQLDKGVDPMGKDLLSEQSYREQQLKVSKYSNASHPVILYQMHNISSRGTLKIIDENPRIEQHVQDAGMRISQPGYSDISTHHISEDQVIRKAPKTRGEQYITRHQIIRKTSDGSTRLVDLVRQQQNQDQ